jgi:hypothetical protein
MNGQDQRGPGSNVCVGPYGEWAVVLPWGEAWASPLHNV